MVTSKHEIITLTTNRLIVRDLNYDDLDFIHVIHSNPEVQKYATLNIPESIDESKDYLRKYMEQQHHNPRKEYGGEGYITEAAVLVLKFGFERLAGLLPFIGSNLLICNRRW
jgi:ribosomal-protein-alanine N-acetyltransferase